MFEFLTATLSCGVINLICVHRTLIPQKTTEQQSLCKSIGSSVDWCENKTPPLYPHITRDRN